MEAGALLEVRGLTVDFQTGPESRVRAVENVSFGLEPGEALAIVGESGSGKSVSMRSLLGLLPKTGRVEGSAMWRPGEVARDLVSMSPRDMRRIRGREIGLVFQNAMQALNPTLSLKIQMTEHLRWHGVCTKDEAEKLAVRSLGDVGIPNPERRIRDYPFQFSGGMQQRVMIAMAMVLKPRLLIADEPTTAVDVTLQRQILDLMLSFRAGGTSMIMITHDLAVAAYTCERVMVMYSGSAMEAGTTSQVLGSPAHPYTRGLLGSALELGIPNELVGIPGNPPDIGNRQPGCPFRPRCDLPDLPACHAPLQISAVASGATTSCWRTHVD